MPSRFSSLPIEPPTQAAPMEPASGVNPVEQTATRSRFAALPVEPPSPKEAPLERVPIVAPPTQVDQQAGPANVQQAIASPEGQALAQQYPSTGGPADAPMVQGQSQTQFKPVDTTVVGSAPTAPIDMVDSLRRASKTGRYEPSVLDGGVNGRTLGEKVLGYLADTAEKAADVGLTNIGIKLPEFYASSYLGLRELFGADPQSAYDDFDNNWMTKLVKQIDRASQFEQGKTSARVQELRGKGRTKQAGVLAVSNGLLDTIAFLKGISTLKLGYGGGAEQSGGLTLKILSTLTHAQKIAFFSAMTQRNATLEDRIKTWKIASLYMSTPAISGLLNNPAGVKALDFALNSLISTFKGEGDYRSILSDKNMDGFEKTMALVNMFGADIVFSAMTKSLGAESGARKSIDQLNAIDAQVRENMRPENAQIQIQATTGKDNAGQPGTSSLRVEGTGEQGSRPASGEQISTEQPAPKPPQEKAVASPPADTSAQGGAVRSPTLNTEPYYFIEDVPNVNSIPKQVVNAARELRIAEKQYRRSLRQGPDEIDKAEEDRMNAMADLETAINSNAKSLTREQVDALKQYTTSTDTAAGLSGLGSDGFFGAKEALQPKPQEGNAGTGVEAVPAKADSAGSSLAPATAKTVQSTAESGQPTSTPSSSPKVNDRTASETAPAREGESSSTTLVNKAGKERTIDVVNETDKAYLYRDAEGNQKRLMKTAWGKKEDAKDIRGSQTENAGKPTDQLTKPELQARAKELGVSFEPTTLTVDLRRKVRQAESGGFVDMSVATRNPDTKNEHFFIKQQRRNDQRVHEWQKRHKKDWVSKVRSQFVDRQGDIKKALENNGGDEAAMRLVLRQGASSEASRLFKEAEKKILSILPRSDMTLLKDYIAALRVVEATKVQADKGIELKSPVEAEAAKDWLNTEFKNLPVERRDAVSEAAKTYWGVMREQLDTLYKEGLIGKEAYDSIVERHKFYSPRRFVDFIDPVTQNASGEKTHDSGVKNLGEGSDSALAQDPMYLMANVLTRTQSRVFQNRANKSLYDLTQTEGGTELARPLKRFKKKDGTYRFEPSKRNEGIVKVFIDGVETRMAMDKRMAEEWNGLPPALTQDMAKFLQWASGTKVLKALATGANPEFAISNLPRDAFYAWFTSGQYSHVLPKALVELGTDYGTVIKDAVKRTGSYKDYIKEGGGMDFLTTQGVTRKPNIEGGSRVLRKIGDILAWAGETSEIATRLAVRNRAVKNGLSTEKATYAARNMLDFSQGGTFTKAADNVIPYLNAAVQGTRGGFRAFKTDPAGTSFKAAQLAAIGYGMAYAVAALFPDLWDSISDREKATKWIIPLPWTKKDRNGNTRHAYIAIPKDQFQQFFSAVGQSMADGQSGRPWGGQILSSLQSISPVDATQLPPVVAASIAYFGNYDTWTKEKVWRGYEDISPSKEQSWRTPEIASDVTDMASKMGIEVSPERLSTATSKIIPSSNPIGGILASMYSASQFDNEQDIGKSAVEKIKDTPGLRRILRFSQPSNVQPYTQEKADRLKIDTKGMTDLEARRAVREAGKSQADVRQPLNVSVDKFMAEKRRTSTDLRTWLTDNVSDVEERKRLWNRAKTRYPDIVKGSFANSPIRPKKPQRPKPLPRG